MSDCHDEDLGGVVAPDLRRAGRRRSGRVLSTLPDAVLFDMDGLLVDTEPLWFLAERQVVGALGGTWTKDHQQDLLGSNLEFAAGYMLRLTGSELSTDEVAQRLKDTMTGLLQTGEFSFRPGALALLASVQDAGVATAIVTSSVGEHLDLVLARMPSRNFDVVVTGDDVTHKKPHPEPYQTALDRLGVEPARAVVLEDSPAGVAAAEAAGCAVIAVPSVVPIESGPRRVVVDSLADVRLSFLADLTPR
jgi:HAD superfamily hydrolase (TIGR01509 family)